MNNKFKTSLHHYLIKRYKFTKNNLYLNAELVMKNIKTIIIDDEPDCVRMLSLQLSQHCVGVEVIASCTDSETGLKKILELKPDLVFLDIEMPRMNGLQLLERVGDISFSLIFVTAYDRYAVQAFRYSAIDYLLKPVDTEELLDAVHKVQLVRQTSTAQISHLKEQLSVPEPKQPTKLALPYQNGVTFVDINSILYCEADSNYTKFVLIDGQTHLVAKTLREIQLTLEALHFLRIHRQYLVNLNGIIHVSQKNEGLFVQLSDQNWYPVSRSQRDRLNEKLRLK